MFSVDENTASRLLLNDLVGHNLGDAHRLLDGDHNNILSLIPVVPDLLGEVLRPSRELDIVTGLAGLIGEVKEVRLVVVDVEELVLGLLDDGLGGAVGRGDHVHDLLAVEDVGGLEVALSVAVLSGLGDGDGEDLAGAALDEHVASLLQLTGGDGGGEGGSGVGVLNSVILIISGHGCSVGWGGEKGVKLWFGCFISVNVRCLGLVCDCDE
mmetsp:Transcript_17385/g.35309  ORF Transcript_17385/g.35309 Transcript_17385/m.35309 type:complete len:211 (+) Transcript_17385:60-692(+)